MLHDMHAHLHGLQDEACIHGCVFQISMDGGVSEIRL